MFPSLGARATDKEVTNFTIKRPEPLSCSVARQTLRYDADLSVSPVEERITVSRKGVVVGCGHLHVSCQNIFAFFLLS